MSKYLKAFALLLFTLVCSSLFSQNLQRRAMLGLILSPVTEEAAKELKVNGADGAFVKKIIPNSTAALLKLQEKDIITSINSVKVKNPDGLIAVTSKLQTGADINLTVHRNGKTLNIKGKMAPMPEETTANGKVIYDEVKINSGYVRSIIRVPDNQNQKHPVIFYIPGYGCGSTDFIIKSSSEKMLIDEFINAGFAVFTIEKPGIGDSKGKRHCNEIGFWEQMEIYREGYKKMVSYNQVDAEKVFLFGHSLGGTIAPVIAEEFPTKGMAVYGVVGKPWMEYLFNLFREQRAIANDNFMEIEDDMRLIIPMLHDFFILKKSPEELVVQNQDYKRILEDVMGAELSKGTMFGRHYTFKQEINEVNLTKALKNAAVPLLAIYGEADLPAINPSGARAMVDIVNYYYPGKGTYLFIPETDHGMMKTGTMEEYVKTKHGGQQTAKEPEFNRELPEKVIEWLKGLK